MAGVTLAVPAMTTPSAAAGSSVATPQVAVPAYIDPGAYPAAWDQLLSAGSALGFVVANVASGPGTSVDPGWASVLSQANADGVRVLGYVNTGYLGTTGQTTATGSTAMDDWVAQAEADVQTWYALYGPDLSGIFFDQVQNACGPTTASDSWADAYASLRAFVSTDHPGAMTVANPGTVVPQCYAGAADVLVTFEGDYQAYTQSYLPLSWAAAPGQVWHIVYDVPAADAAAVVQQAASRGAGYVFVTDAGLPDPYGTMPSPTVWSAELAAAGSSGSSSSAGSSGTAGSSSSTGSSGSSGAAGASGTAGSSSSSGAASSSSSTGSSSSSGAAGASGTAGSSSPSSSGSSGTSSGTTSSGSSGKKSSGSSGKGSGKTSTKAASTPSKKATGKG